MLAALRQIARGRRLKDPDAGQKDSRHPEQQRQEGVFVMSETKKDILVPTEKDLEVIRLMRQTDYGKVLVTVKNGEPVHVEIQKSIPIK